jgi:predicted N-acetyltransferase YhbS
MELAAGHAGWEPQIIDLCAAAFTASEGEAEGASIARLVTDLLSSTPGEDILVVRALEGGTLVGAAGFSRLRYDEDDRTVFLLSPVAVRTDRQGEGVGQTMLTYGLDLLREKGVDVVLSYGDPSYYAKVGFRQVAEHLAAPPRPLSDPPGWLGQSLTDRDMRPLAGRSQCVPALDRPEYW